MDKRTSRRTSPVRLLGLLTIAAIALTLLPAPEEPAGIHQVDLPDLAPGGSVKVGAGTNTAPVESQTDAGLGGNLALGDGVASFEFAPALWDTNPPTWRFRGDDGWASVSHVQVHYTDANGAPLDTTGSKLFLHGPRQFSLEPTAIEAGQATFTIQPSHLAGAKESTWRIAFDAEGRHWFGGSSALDATTIRWIDTDGDGHPQDADVCPGTPDANQRNTDGDLHGDACDSDDDNDSFSDSQEAQAGSDPRNSASTPNDLDADGAPNSAEATAGSDPRNRKSTPDDPDADGATRAEEDAAGSDNFNAKSTPNDVDADGIPNDLDNCGRIGNENQRDDDGDGIGTACDAQPDDGPSGDADGDGVTNAMDRCPAVADDQFDLDGDGVGDACDTDGDGDGIANVQDAFPSDATEWHDSDGDGVGNNRDDDDDNDGLLDVLELQLGSNLTSLDSDDDGLGDLFEHIQETDLLDPLDPDPRAQGLALHASAAGVHLTWHSGPATNHVDGYAVWRTTEAGPSLVDHVSFANRAIDGSGMWQLTDRAPPGGDALYSVQPMVDGVTIMHPEWAISAALWAENLPMLDQALGALEQDTESTPVANPGQPTVAPEDKGAPGPLAPLVGVGALGIAARRRGLQRDS